MRLSLLSWPAAVLLVFGLMTAPQLPAKDKSDAPPAKEDGKGPKEGFRAHRATVSACLTSREVLGLDDRSTFVDQAPVGLGGFAGVSFSSPSLRTCPSSPFPP